MGFFLVGRVADNGSLSLITPEEFSTRQKAIETLSSMTVDPSLESEIFVVDLDVATPVLLVRQQQTESAAEASPALKPEEGPVSETEQSDELADALRRATNALEDEGIQPPESIGAVPAMEAVMDEPESGAVEPPQTDSSAEDVSISRELPTEEDESWPWEMSRKAVFSMWSIP